MSGPSTCATGRCSCLGFAGALRRSEIVGLDLEHLSDDADGLRVRLVRSKTDQEGQGRVVGIPFGGRPGTCPVRGSAGLAGIGDRGRGRAGVRGAHARSSAGGCRGARQDGRGPTAASRLRRATRQCLTSARGPGPPPGAAACRASGAGGIELRGVADVQFGGLQLCDGAAQVAQFV